MNIHLSITAANVCCVLASWRLSAFRSRPHTELISSTDTDSALLCIVVCIFYSALGSFYCTARLTLFVLLPLSFSLLLKRSCLIAWSTRLRLPAASATFSALLSASLPQNHCNLSPVLYIFTIKNDFDAFCIPDLAPGNPPLIRCEPWEPRHYNNSCRGIACC